ncbi:hypothetical protein AYI70_g10510 [Smittium culicis]|uniref:Uncharacterized protein n=1 Tax=Smittium culicis TaxID=133412 RepID=A0A1R1X692_9FUNG|nr:hypothetical protein AYI70_g10510 [Smittium culicis]
MHRNTYELMGHYGTLWKIIGNQRKSWNAMETYGASKNIMINFGIQWNVIHSLNLSFKSKLSPVFTPPFVPNANVLSVLEDILGYSIGKIVLPLKIPSVN